MGIIMHRGLLTSDVVAQLEHSVVERICSVGAHPMITSHFHLQ